MENFVWPGLLDDVAQFVASCVECQVTKYETKKAAGLLCPFSVPHRPWEDLSLDFIIGLPAYQGNKVILVVVDRFPKVFISTCCLPLTLLLQSPHYFSTLS